MFDYFWSDFKMPANVSLYIKVLILHIGLLFEKAYKNIMKLYECYIFEKQLRRIKLLHWN